MHEYCSEGIPDHVCAVLNQIRGDTAKGVRMTTLLRRLNVYLTSYSEICDGDKEETARIKSDLSQFIAEGMSASDIVVLLQYSGMNVNYLDGSWIFESNAQGAVLTNLTNIGKIGSYLNVRGS